jgi:thiamine biosynthesis lipoprotein
MAGPNKTRRELLLGGTSGQRIQPEAGSTLRLSIQAMACDFAAAVNPGQTDQLLACGDALEIVPHIESWLSTYQPNSELSRLNAVVGNVAIDVSSELFDLLLAAKELHRATDGAFDMASGGQIQLWRRCRSEQRIPTEDEIKEALSASGMSKVVLSAEQQQVTFSTPGLSLDPGAIGKGYALDQTIEALENTNNAPRDYLLHGGRSSVVARGEHNNLPGWPIGIGNPLLTKRRLGTVILRNQAMSTSGSNIQFFRCEGRRFGHILDPRTGWPVEGMLSVTVLADSAAVADAVSTAFFVLGVEKTVECCDNLSQIGAILVPFPDKGARVEPVVIGIPPEQLFWDEELVALK